MPRVPGRAIGAGGDGGDHLHPLGVHRGDGGGARAPVIVNPKAEGIAADWNFALAATGAARVTLAHQDDVYFEGFAARSLALLDAQPRAAACFTGYQEIDDDGAPVTSRLSRVKHLIEAVVLGSATAVSGARLRAFLSLGNPLPCSSVTFARDRIADFRFAGGLGVEPRLGRLAAAGRGRACPRPRPRTAWWAGATTPHRHLAADPRRRPPARGPRHVPPAVAATAGRSDRLGLSRRLLRPARPPPTPASARACRRGGSCRRRAGS